jgi:hypothetical protein
MRCMLSTVELDHQSSLRAGEIHDVTGDWHLAPKAETVHLPPAQEAPHRTLGIRRRIP